MSVTSITTAYNAIVTRLGYLYSSNSSYNRLGDPYDLANNKDIFLRKGYGIRYDGASVGDSVFNEFAMSHIFTVVLSRELMKLEGQTTPDDDVTLSLLEDVVSVQKDFYHQSELGVGTDISKIDLGEVSAIEKVNVEKVKFKTVSVSFNFLICSSF